MSDLIKLADSLKHTDATLKLLVEVSEQTLPKITQDVKNITEVVKDGFNQELLKNQAKKAINEGILESNLTALKDEVISNTKILSSAADLARHAANNLEDKVNYLRTIYIAIGAFLLGSFVMWSVQYHRIDHLQDKILYATKMSNFINSSCRLKKEFYTFNYGDKEKMDCNKNWLSPLEYRN